MGKSTFCKPKLSKRRKWFDCAIFMGPSILMFTVLFLIPLGGELLYSFTDWNGVDPTFSFNGVTNYFKTFAEPEYWASLWFTIKFSFFVVIFSNLLAFGWAYILSKDIPLRNLWRALIYVPRIIGGVILGFLWRFYFPECICSVWQMDRMELVFSKLVYNTEFFLLGTGHRNDLDVVRISDDYLWSRFFRD